MLIEYLPPYSVDYTTQPFDCEILAFFTSFSLTYFEQVDIHVRQLK